MEWGVKGLRSVMTRPDLMENALILMTMEKPQDVIRGTKFHRTTLR